MRETIHPKEVYAFAVDKAPQTVTVRTDCIWTAVLTLREAGAACDVVTYHGPRYSLMWRGCRAAEYDCRTGELLIYWPDIRKTARALIIIRPGQTIPEGTYENRPASGTDRPVQAPA